MKFSNDRYVLTDMNLDLFQILARFSLKFVGIDIKVFKLQDEM